MSELIERQAAIDAINKMKIYRPLDSDRYVISDCLNKIVQLPSAQPEIIRCKDCKYSDTDNTLGVMFCWRVSYHEASEDGFCKWAERRTND